MGGAAGANRGTMRLGLGSLDLCLSLSRFCTMTIISIGLSASMIVSKLESDWSSLFVEAFMITKTGLEKFK